MSKSSSSGASSAAAGVTGLKSKSPAEFFAEHQNIAGFDNPGKSLYTTLREFVENSLDAAEAIRALPVIELKIEKLSPQTFHQLRGVEKHTKGDLALYVGNEKPKKGKKSAAAAGEGDGAAGAAASEEKEKDSDSLYFRVTCRDNGGGMPHASIPQMLGVVLSSTKYGVKQTRGKFGLGAKMALVWAMKSTGLPIQVRSATARNKAISYCKLYIDINRNQPDIVAHEQQANDKEWQGTEISVVIGGAWRNYQSKIVNYMRQLAVITPYAQLQLEFVDQSDDSKSWTIMFDRRTDVMPAPPIEVKHHPSSVDNLLVEQLIHHAKGHIHLKQFLKTSFSSISASLADRLCEELSSDFDTDIEVQDMSKKQIHQLTQLLRSASFPQADASCLSPAGEYNLRLGILKELNPEMVATASCPPDVAGGHPFQVEAAVSVGGSKSRPGITIFRYANRIPLLFEGGNDVVSIVANKQIKWSSYKLNNKTDKICVFVSIVSTKIPFKGTSKEYIGDDKGALANSIKKAISTCCVQLRRRLVQIQSVNEKADRKKKMLKYIPDVTRSFMQILHAMNEADGEGASLLNGGTTEVKDEEMLEATAASSTTSSRSSQKRRRDSDEVDDEESRLRYLEMLEKLRIRQEEQQACVSLLRDVSDDMITEELLEKRLEEHVYAKDAEIELAHMDDTTQNERGATQSFYIGGMEQEQIADMKTIYGEEFKITYW